MVRKFLSLLIAIAFSFVESYDLEMSFELNSKEWKQALVDMHLYYSFNKYRLLKDDTLIYVLYHLATSKNDLYKKYTAKFTEKDSKDYIEMINKEKMLPLEIQKKESENIGKNQLKLLKENELNKITAFVPIFEKALDEIKQLISEKADFTKIETDRKDNILRIESNIPDVRDLKDVMSNIKTSISYLGANLEQNEESLKELNSEYAKIQNWISETKTIIKTLENEIVTNENELSLKNKEYTENKDKLTNFKKAKTDLIMDLLNIDVNSASIDVKKSIRPENLTLNMNIRYHNTPVTWLLKSKEFNITFNIMNIFYTDCFVKKPNDESKEVLSFFELFHNGKVPELKTRDNVFNDDKKTTDIKTYNTISYSKSIDRLKISAITDEFANNGVVFKIKKENVDKVENFPELTKDTKLECILFVHDYLTVKASCRFPEKAIII